MIFIIGGKASGKSTFANTIKKEGQIIIDDYELIIKKQLEDGKDVEAETEKLISSNPDSIIISCEMGMGVVPIDRCERQYRELAGRAHIRIAEAADEVYRVICGIGKRIK